MDDRTLAEVADVAEASLRRSGERLTMAAALVAAAAAMLQASANGLVLLTWVYSILAFLGAMQFGARLALRLRTSASARWLYRSIEWPAGAIYERALQDRQE